MKFTIAANELAAALNKVRGVMPGTNTLPILGCFLVRAWPDGTVTVIASHIDVEASANASCQIDRPGLAAISGHLFAIVKGLGKSEITIEVEPGTSRAVLTGARQRYEFGVLNEAEFPSLQIDKPVASFTLPADVLRSALAVTRPATSDKTEYLMGVCIWKRGTNLEFAATDRHRFVLYRTPAPVGSESLVGRRVIPRETVGELVGFLTGATGDASIEIDESAIRIQAANGSLTSKLLHGDFLDYSSITDKPNPVGIELSASEFSAAVARIIALRVETKAPVLTVRSNGESVELVSDKRGANAGVEHVDADVASPIEFSASTTYLAGLIGAWPENATLEISSPEPGDPIAIMSASVPALLQIVMPMTK